MPALDNENIWQLLTLAKNVIEYEALPLYDHRTMAISVGSGETRLRASRKQTECLGGII